MALPLENVRILDFTIMMAGPHGTMMLGDLGADIIKVERPPRLGGPSSRQDERYGLHGGYGRNPEENTWAASSFFAHNRNKKSLTVDLKKAQGREIILRLVQSCDVVYENFRSGVMDRLGLGYDDCRQVNPSIIYASATGYGPDGPYAHRPGQDLLAQALSGIDVINAPAGGRPTPVAMSVPDLLAAIYGAYGVIGALFHRQRTGEGQRVQVSLLNSSIAALSELAVHVMNTGVEPSRGSEMHACPFIPPPYGVFKTRDGYISISGSQTLPTLSKVLGIANMAEDVRFNTYWKRVNNRAEMNAMIEAALAKHTTAEWMAVMDKADLWAAPVQTLAEAFSDPQVLHNNMILTVDSPAGPLKMPGFPYKLSKTPAQVRMPAPLLGEHTDGILQAAGYGAADIEAFRVAEVI